MLHLLNFIELLFFYYKKLTIIMSAAYYYCELQYSLVLLWMTVLHESHLMCTNYSIE